MCVYWRKECILSTPHFSGPLLPTKSCRGAGGDCRRQGGGELERWTAIPLSQWNEWYGAGVSIHACYFTSLTPFLVHCTALKFSFFLLMCNSKGGIEQ